VREQDLSHFARFQHKSATARDHIGVVPAKFGDAVLSSESWQARRLSNL
jgi:hypothetical protein